MPQLDSLRAFAVGSVMLWHFHPGIPGRFIPLGMGVQLFFVLSGFLITGILLRGAPNAEFIGRFYIRRALRLFPLYYVVIAIVAIFSQEMRDAWSFYALYGANFWVVENQRWGVATHFWSLAVEEQFYLIWPFVVLWTLRRRLVLMCVILIVAGPIFRLGMALIARNDFAFVLLPGSADALSCGALLALLGPPRLTPPALVVASISAAGSVLFWRYGSASVISVALFSICLPLMYVIVGGAARGFSGAIGWLLMRPTLRYLGKISYGLYVIHLFMAEVAQYLFYHISIDHPYAVATICAGATITLAAISWHFLESPINRRRDLIARTIFAGRGDPNPIKPPR